MVKPPDHPGSLRKVLSALRRGRMIILVDDRDRENEGDLVIP
ncbi:MAG TPA: 3,4-dihydroxy-2-butanone-4-phosphate synthase, partial [Planctomycetota bacterium]|nr:3,4-dihydroxy-2-butanone-4-phosphate synthase [Planctomycetota bacterium]